MEVLENKFLGNVKETLDLNICLVLNLNLDSLFRDLDLLYIKKE